MLDRTVKWLGTGVLGTTVNSGNTVGIIHVIRNYRSGKRGCSVGHGTEVGDEKRTRRRRIVYMNEFVLFKYVDVVNRKPRVQGNSSFYGLNDHDKFKRFNAG